MDDLRWRTATIVVTAIAALEFVALAGAGVAIFGNPLASDLGPGTAKAAPTRKHVVSRPLPTKTTLTRADTVVMVLNGNGQSGSAATAAQRLRAQGYLVGDIGDAPRMDYAHSLIMYRRGYAAEGLRLAHDLHVHIVSPLDGMRPAQLLGAHLVLVVGAG
jgi:LytR cell envelope-related transcriptional attenuator